MTGANMHASFEDVCNAEVEALRDEYHRNVRRIAELEAENRSLRSKLNNVCVNLPLLGEISSEATFDSWRSI